MSAEDMTNDDAYLRELDGTLFDVPQPASWRDMYRREFRNPPGMSRSKLEEILDGVEARALETKAASEAKHGPDMWARASEWEWWK